MLVTCLFALSISLLTFTILYGVLRYCILPEATFKKRLQSLNELTTVEVSRMMSSMPSNSRSASQNPNRFFNRIIRPWLNSVQNSLYQLTPSAITKLISRKLVVAGKHGTITVESFAAVCAVFFAIGMGLAYNYVSKGDFLFIQSAAIIFIGGVLGSFVPIAILNIAIDRRKKNVLRQLPEFLDLLCVSVQAGLTFEAAVNNILQRFKGPLADEFSQAMEDMRMGMPRRTALKNMTERVDLPELSLFITSVIQSERLGTSIGNTLAIQADNMRERRRQYIRAQALKAPVKMLFPLIMFIFPALFIVVLLPVVLTLIKHFF
ncbi:type II secretion system F family protein [uncultured Anaerovibrio sp.]|uniref:type II secretion system F family protein n=2 Tax=Anaerovibrio TaxID=82373 RepID=UPI00260C64BC|nr:type II secretion system F family protein [uncultured Anaerovibrio sp.]